MSYFKDIQDGIRTTLKGLSLTLRHIGNATKRRTPEGIASENYFDQQNGLVTLQYPHEQLPIPDNGRYRLRNEIDDCIVCDKCAKICPVDCITIDAIKATEEVGRASDGSPIRLYAAKFDIDMAKCCYCGLCTVVCPTECLTMDKKFDYSEFELGKLTYHFSNLSSEQADEKRSLYEQFLAEKEAAKATLAAAKANQSQETNVVNPAVPPKPAPARPVFRPTAKPASKPVNSEGSSIEHPLTDATPDEMQQIAQGGLETAKHPTFEPGPAEPINNEINIPEKAQDEPIVPKPVAKPAFRPTMKPPVAAPDETANAEVPKTKPAFKPTMKPPVAKTDAPDAPNPTETPASKPAGFRPTMKPAKSVSKSDEVKTEETQPTPTNEVNETPDPPVAEASKPKPAFRPTMKPKPKEGDSA